MPTSEQATALRETASLFLSRGYAPMPVTVDKAPRRPGVDPDSRESLIAWKRYQTTPPPAVQVERWFTHPDTRGIGLVLAPRPGGLACLDFDNPDEYDAIDTDLRQGDDELSAIWARLHRWHERTPGGGVHLLFTIDDAQTIPKLEKIDTLGIGKASHCVMHPTPGYRLISEGKDPAHLAQEELETLTDYIRARQEPRTTPAASQTAQRPYTGIQDDANLPGGDYNRRGDHRQLLEAHGWKFLRKSGDEEYWRRPGKDTGQSGTWGYAGEPLFHCFTSSVPDLEADRSYSLFALYAALEHGGDYAAAARELRLQGYGKPDLQGARITIDGEIIRPGDRAQASETFAGSAQAGSGEREEMHTGKETFEDSSASEEHTTAGDGPFRLLPAGSPEVLRDVAADILNRRDLYLKTGSAIRGHYTGFPKLDDHLGGLEPGRVTILQAEPGAGKTTLSNQVAYTLACAGVPVLYVSFENEPADLIRKQIARIADKNPRFLDRGTIDPEPEISAAVDRFEDTAQTLYYLDGTSETTLETIRGGVAYIVNKHPHTPPVLIVDYLQQLARVAGGNGREDIFTRIGLVSRGLTDIAKNPGFRCHIWAISSMNRESYRNGPKNAAPGMAAAKGSGDLEFDASAVLSLVKGDPAEAPDSNHDLLRLHIVKNRYGPGGQITLRRNLRSLAVEEAEGPSLSANLTGRIRSS